MDLLDILDFEAEEAREWALDNQPWLLDNDFDPRDEQDEDEEDW